MYIFFKMDGIGNCSYKISGGMKNINKNSRGISSHHVDIPPYFEHYAYFSILYYIIYLQQ